VGGDRSSASRRDDRLRCRGGNPYNALAYRGGSPARTVPGRPRVSNGARRSATPTRRRRYRGFDTHGRAKGCLPLAWAAPAHKPWTRAGFNRLASSGDYTSRVSAIHDVS
jgi:hypothetical protein